LREDILLNRLPAVTFVEPTYQGYFGIENDEHPNTNIQLGQSWTYQVLAALMAKPEIWSHTIVFLTWDEHGGYYDHVKPPKACPPDGKNDQLDFQFDRYGFRVPLLAVSPFAKKGYVSHAVADHTSILRFIEHWQNLPALTRRDANAWPLLDLFDFTTTRSDVGMPDPAMAAITVTCP